MKNIRIIPKLEIKNNNLVKGINLEGLRVIGNPISFINEYYLNGADEIIIQDVVASLYGTNCLFDIISKISKKIFIPTTVGGGIKTIEDISQVLKYGADKVCINTAAINNPEFISEAANHFGSSSITVLIEAKKLEKSIYYAYYNSGRDNSGINVIAWSKQVEKLGAGEILLTSIDNDGTGNGFDYQIIKDILNVTNIPLIVSGGAGNLNHILELINNYDIDGVALSSIIHYSLINNLKFSKDDSKIGNKEFLINNGKKIIFKVIN